MERCCVICKSEQYDRLYQEVWEVTGLGTIDIGMVICGDCGFVYQHPLVPPDKMAECYTQLSNYTNPARQGKPCPTKVALVDSQLQFVRSQIDASGKALQIGCSDGYTLSRFRSDGWMVKGVEPSEKAVAIAKARYDVDCTAAFIEDYVAGNDESYDLVIMTHVLEHIYQPDKTLKKCHELLNDDGYLYIEVPSLVDQEKWSSGYFSFEHVNYFSPVSMTNLLEQHGFKLVSNPETIDYEGSNPALRCLARKVSQMQQVAPISDYERAYSLCNQYLSRDNAIWQKAQERVARNFEGMEQFVIWGGGIHTTQLLARTNIARLAQLDFIVDVDPQKQGKALGRYDIKGPEAVDYTNSRLAIVISSYAWEAEILKHLSALPDRKARIIPLYREDN